MKTVLILFLSLAGLASAAPLFETLTELKPGDATRAALFDILRPVHEKNAGEKKLKFRGTVTAYKDYAIFVGDSVDAKGEAVIEKKSGSDNSDIVALWKHSDSGWKLLDYSFGHSDVFWEPWIARYGMPREFFYGP